MSDALQEIELKFADKTYSIRPDFQTIVAVEAGLGQSSRVLGMKCLNYDISVSEIAAMLVIILKDKPDAPKRDQIGDLVMEYGFNDLLLPLGMFLTRAQKGHREHVKEAQAAAKANP
jgi:hypothetical protein